MSGGPDLRVTGADHPDAVALDQRVQAWYRDVYGDPDLTVLGPGQFTPPRGLYLVGYDERGRPVASGGWRAREASTDDPPLRDGDAELKRMYVVPEARGRGYARAVLAELERTAAAAGRRRAVLETGTEQPEAIALYTRAGYRPIAAFGAHRADPRSRCFAKPLTA